MPPAPLATRRTTLLGAGTVALLGAGCSADDLDPRPAPAGSSTSPAADEALVTRMARAVSETAAVVAAARTSPRLDDALAGLAALHQAHLAELTPDAVATAPTAAPTQAPASRREVLARERRLQAELAAAAGEAGNGELAANLASMSAAVAQQLAVVGRR